MDYKKMSELRKTSSSRSMRKDLPAKECAACGKTYKRTYAQSVNAFNLRKVCSDACAITKSQTDVLKRNELKHGKGCLDDKKCGVCSVIMSYEIGTPALRFINKRGCSKPCSAKLRGMRGKEARKRTKKAERLSMWSIWQKKE